jgi:hypothetical protein
MLGVGRLGKGLVKAMSIIDLLGSSLNMTGPVVYLIEISDIAVVCLRVVTPMLSPLLCKSARLSKSNCLKQG